MDWTTNVAVHESAGPDFTRERILASLARGEVDPALLYAGTRQTTLWLALHREVSPALQDASVISLYQQAFASAAGRFKGNVVHLVSLACGSGGKDLAAIQELRSSERAVIYTPADFSLEMVLTAQRAAADSFRGLQCTPLVCELLRCSVLPAILKGFDPSGAERLILFLGTVHNYWPPDILKSILYPLRSQDRLLLSANLAPAAEYEPALRRILAQYDNPPTRAWLWGALSELGLTENDGQLSFHLPAEDRLPSLKRVEARFEFTRPREIQVFESSRGFSPGDTLRVFHSHRFTPDHIRAFLAQVSLVVEQEWLAPEEGLFLCRRM